MSKIIYRKLKDYIQETDSGTTSIFGTLHDSRNIYYYEDENGEWKEYNCCGSYCKGEMEHLLDYYVVGIYPRYEIIKDKIVVKLGIVLKKELKVLDIIKEKQVNASALLEVDNLQEYNEYCDMVSGCKKLTQEEYELLKEVLL